MLETGFICQFGGKKAIRRPDIGLVRHNNPVALNNPDRSYRGIYDLCLEGLSDSNRAVKENDTKVKPVEYANAGVKEYYILFRKLDECVFYRLNQRGVYVPLRPGRGGVFCSQVLPGFQWRLEELETQPELIDLVDHLVYKEFVWTPLSQARRQTDIAQRHAVLEADLRSKAERLLAEPEHARRTAKQHAAEQARLRLDAERDALRAKQKAQHYAERLRALGIDPDTE